MEKTAMIRVRAGISFALAEAMDEGHYGLPADELAVLTEKLIEVSPALIEAALTLELESGEVVADRVEGRRCVFLAGLHRAEQAIAEHLRVLAAGRPPWPGIDAAKAVPWVEARTGLTLAESQLAAVRLALRSKVLVITGGPGVGKTTLVNSILRILTAKGVEVALCAPTGRAAKRLSESTGLEAQTIHRLLETDPKTGGFKRDETHPLACDLLVDVDQLPSVEPDQVLADVIVSGAVPVVRLTEVFRQAARSRVIVNAHRINQGQMPELEAAEPGEGCAALTFPLPGIRV
jgi:exodeoxyribonuclease V alpha subunit